MRRAFAFLLAVPLWAAVGPGRAAAPARPTPVKAFLCDSADHAIMFADVVAGGESTEMARGRVARGASPDSCGRYVGIAVIETQRVMVKGGMAYKLTAYRFTEDRRLAWRAERSFAPSSSGWDL